MDELELLKKNWQQQKDAYPKLSYNDIYKMIHAKSSSIVKWLFIISLLEFAFWIVISFILKQTDSFKDVNTIDMDAFIIPLTVITYGVLIYFFYRFYMNYKNISTTDSSKVLMENILRTRRTVKHYVIFNLASLVIGAFVGIFYVMANDPVAAVGLDRAAASGEIFKFYASIIVISMGIIALIIGLLLFFYWVIYGLLLRKLNRNYRELKKMEV